MLGALGHDGFVTHLHDTSGQFVVVKQLSVPERGRFLSEQFLDDSLFAFKLMLELGLTVFRGQRVGIRSGYELNGLGVRQFLHGINHFGRKLLEQLQKNTADCYAATELAARHLDHLGERAHEGQVRVLRQPYNLVFGLQVIEIVVILTDVEKTITFQPIRRMHLKAKTNISHNGY